MSDRCSTTITSSLQTMQQDMIGQCHRGAWGLGLPRDHPEADLRNGDFSRSCHL
jgi:hypothetical protein